MEAATAPRSQQPQDEREAVRRWRCEQLERAGYTGAGAALLAGDAEIDVHRAAELLARGCPETLALRILL